jgi:hypothetical protein
MISIGLVLFVTHVHDVATGLSFTLLIVLFQDSLAAPATQQTRCNRQFVVQDYFWYLI